MPEVTIDQAITIAVARYRAGDIHEADAMCRQILAVQPRHGDALNLLGTIFHDAGRIDIAIDLVRRAIEINPAVPAYHGNLGNLLRTTGRLDEAVASYRTALALKPDLVEVYSNLGAALAEAGQLDQAVTAFQTAIALKPNLVEAHNNLGNALSNNGRIDGAIDAYRAALAIAPDHVEIHCNLAMCLLLSGDLANGWREYEWRLKSDEADHQARKFSQPRWQGEDLTGKTILLHAEQGFGDTLQFIRYVRLVAERGGNVIVECQPELITLFRQIECVREWVSPAQTPPAFDVHCPLVSLPLVFSTTLESIPHQQPPLRAPFDRWQFWRLRAGGDSAKRKVGIAWAGNAEHKNDRYRSIPISLLNPLSKVPRVQFVSLQKGAAAAELQGSAFEPNTIDSTGEIRDFADMAGMIAHLDMVITVDTAVAHLAAAMQKPVWLLVPFAPDWRWLLERSDTPWYPTMRLFRQSRIRDWSDTIDRVAGELATFARDD